MLEKKFILVGKNSFLSQNFSSFLRKKKIKFLSISYNKFLKLSHKRLKDYEAILNFSTNNDFVRKKYAVKNDFDVKIAKIIKYETAVKISIKSYSKIGFLSLYSV